MPVFYQHPVNASTRLAVWKIEENEDFFRRNVPLHRDVTHPHKRLQHLAGRFLLQYLFPGFPYELVQIADTRKPFLPEEQFHFSISHCGDYAAAIVSSTHRVGVDAEIPAEKIGKIVPKYLTEEECSMFNVQCSMFNESQPETQKSGLPTPDSRLPTLLWSAKEAVFKWYGDGGVDFRKHIQLFNHREETQTMDCFFAKDGSELVVHYRQFEGLVLTWVLT